MKKTTFYLLLFAALWAAFFVLTSCGVTRYNGQVMGKSNPYSKQVYRAPAGCRGPR